MEMKAMMFAGGGLFLSMVATTVWISGDVTRMRAEERAKEAQKCAIAQQADAPPPVTDTPPAGDLATPAAQADSSCDDASTQVAPTNGAVDPVTGEPLGATAADPQAAQFQDSNAADPGASSIDPNTGQPLDPNTGQPIGSGATSIDPNTGQPIANADPAMGQAVDPTLGQGTNGTPTPAVADPGF